MYLTICSCVDESEICSKQSAMMDKLTQEDGHLNGDVLWE